MPQAHALLRGSAGVPQHTRGFRLPPIRHRPACAHPSTRGRLLGSTTGRPCRASRPVILDTSHRRSFSLARVPRAAVRACHPPCSLPLTPRATRCDVTDARLDASAHHLPSARHARPPVRAPACHSAHRSQPRCTAGSSVAARQRSHLTTAGGRRRPRNCRLPGLHPWRTSQHGNLVLVAIALCPSLPSRGIHGVTGW